MTFNHLQEMIFSYQGSNEEVINSFTLKHLQKLFCYPVEEYGEDDIDKEAT